MAELKPVRIGVKGNSPQDLIGLVKYGFTMISNSAAGFDAMIAEAAYFKAEKRGFSAGNELKDWLEAKNEIIRSVYGDEQAGNELVET